MRYLLATAVVVAATAATIAFQNPYIAVNVGGTTTCHPYDHTKLTVVEKKLTDGVVVWRVMREDGLIMGTLATKPQAEAALAATKKFKTMCLIGRSPHRFTYFE